MHQLIRIQPGSTPARQHTAPRGETVRFRLTGLVQETITPWAGALPAITLPVRLLGDVLLTDERLLFSGKFWVRRKPSRFWAINDALEGGGTNYAKRAAQFVERRDIHAVGYCLLDCVDAVQLERPDTELVRVGNAPNIGFCTVQGQSLSCVSIRPLDDPPAPWSVYLGYAQFIVRCVASARSRQYPNDDTLRRLMGDAHYDASNLECVGWGIPYCSPVPANES
jgi:hypothetical protein